LSSAARPQINTAHPDNVECLRYLVHLCSELGRRAEATEFMNKLKKAEKVGRPERLGRLSGRRRESLDEAAGTAAAAANDRPHGGVPAS
jgi:intraflagellar transport protein 88